MRLSAGRSGSTAKPEVAIGHTWMALLTSCHAKVTSVVVPCASAHGANFARLGALGILDRRAAVIVFIIPIRAPLPTHYPQHRKGHIRWEHNFPPASYCRVPDSWHLLVRVHRPTDNVCRQAHLWRRIPILLRWATFFPSHLA